MHLIKIRSRDFFDSMESTQEINDRMDAIQLHLALNQTDESATKYMDTRDHSYVLWNNKGGVGIILITLLILFIF